MTRLITGIALGIGSSLVWRFGRWIAAKRSKATEIEETLEPQARHRRRGERLHDAEDGVAENAWDR